MSKALNTFLICCLALTSFQAAIAATECDPAKWKYSKLDIEINDTDYLKMVMGFSYGQAVTNFIPHLRLAQSNMYYAESKAQPLLTFFRTEFKEEKDATAALNHLKSKWLGNKNNQYDLYKAGNTVVWFGNNRLESECFYKMVANEKKSLR